jgi:hypothetical protein
MSASMPARNSFFNHFYRVTILPGFILFIIISYYSLTQNLQPGVPTSTHAPWVRMAGAFLIAPVTILLGWLVSRRLKSSFIGPVIMHWGFAINMELALGYLPPFWAALSLYYLSAYVLPGLPLMLASFPTGYGVTPFWDRVMKAAALIFMGVALLLNLSAPTAYGLPAASPLALEQLLPLANTIGVLISLTTFGLFILTAVLVVYRYRITSEIERKQMRWLMAGTVSLVVLIISTNPLESYRGMNALADFLLNITVLLFLAFPSVAISLAILRHRVWDIDIIIRRTLVYSLLTGLLALLYYGSVTVLQGVFTALGGAQSTIATVISTLAIAALFNPLRRRLQDFIDRRFYRSKYDAEIALEGFATAARSESEIEPLISRLVGVVQESMQPESLGLWLIRKR